MSTGSLEDVELAKMAIETHVLHSFNARAVAISFDT